MPALPFKIMMNVANPERAFDFGQLPNAGIGLARLEMIIASHIGIHPKALLEYASQDAATKKKIDERIAGYAGPVEFYVDRLAEGIATIMYALEHRRELSGRWSWLLIAGLMDILVAFFIIAGLPESAGWAIGLLVGLNLMFGGATLIGMALAARNT